jgi:hypothetical protein
VTFRIGYINAVLALIVVALLGVACYLHLDCRNLEALLAEGWGPEANVLSSSPPAAVAPTLGGMPTSPSATVAPSVSVTEQLEELRTELAEAEAERKRLEQEIARLEENRKELLKENTISMAELAELDSEAYAAFTEKLREHYARFRQGVDLQHHREMLKILEDDAGFRMKSSDRQRCEEYLSRYQEYVDGVLDGIWSKEEAEERYQQLDKFCSDDYKGWLYETLLNKLYPSALGVKTYDEAEDAVRISANLAKQFLMTDRVEMLLQKSLAREMLERDCPPLDYGLAPDETDAEVRQLEEWMSYRRERP